MKKLLAIGLVVVLGGAAGDRLVTDFTNRLTDPNPNVRIKAAQKLSHYGPRAAAAVYALRDALNDPNRYVRRWVIYALDQIGPEARAADAALTKALGDEDLGVRALAAAALESVHRRDATPYVLPVAQEANAPQRRPRNAFLGPQAAKQASPAEEP